MSGLYIFLCRTLSLFLLRGFDCHPIDFICASDIRRVITGEFMRESKSEDDGDEGAAEPRGHVPSYGVDGVAGG